MISFKDASTQTDKTKRGRKKDPNLSLKLKKPNIKTIYKYIIKEPPNLLIMFDDV